MTVESGELMEPMEEMSRPRPRPWLFEAKARDFCPRDVHRCMFFPFLFSIPLDIVCYRPAVGNEGAPILLAQ